MQQLLFLKILSEKANSVDPEQTVPFRSCLIWVCTVSYIILSDTLVFEILGHLP